MERIAFYFLRIGLGLTFLVIGIFILRDPEIWGSFINSSLLQFLPISLRNFMIGVAIFDIAIGVSFLLNFLTWIFALLASLHLIGILLVSGINSITTRDIGLLGATITLFLITAPKDLLEKLPYLTKWKQKT